MTAPCTSRVRNAHHLNQLRRGETYRAHTSAGATVGEYLGIETPYGRRAILLRSVTGTTSIPVDALERIRPLAA